MAGLPTGNAVNQSLAEATVAPGAATEEHYHRLTEEIYFFTHGSGRLRVGDEEREVEPGDTVVIAPGLRHKLWNTGARAAAAAVLLRPGLLARGHGHHRVASRPWPSRLRWIPVARRSWWSTCRTTSFAPARRRRCPTRATPFR